MDCSNRAQSIVDDGLRFRDQCFETGDDIEQFLVDATLAETIN
jgi:hypothetical protein